jgi:hypothetical protein
MKRQIKDKTVYENTKTTMNEHGEITKKEHNTVTRTSSEPHFIKIYFDTVLVFQELPKNITPLVGELLRRMTYANSADKYGGQLIILNPFVKQEIAEALDVKVNTIEHRLTQLVNKGIFKRVGTGAYQANPNYFGRGDWHDIKSIRATFNFNTGTIKADIERGPARETPMQQLEKQAKKFFEPDAAEPEE